MKGRILEFVLSTLVINVVAIITAVLITTKVGKYIEGLFETMTDVLTNVNTFL
ncbi:hypothetical protein KAX02_13845 [candidate division WOR-3 bacterium]|nr:hypothetical protein [candidate division WOR-3 bacterium]